MDQELEELESLFSDHFGTTPLSTPYGSVAASQISVSDEEDTTQDVADDDLDLVNVRVDADALAQRYMEASGAAEDLDERAAGDGRGEDDAEDTDLMRVRHFLKYGCGCKQSCEQYCKESEIYEHILKIQDMSKIEKELYIIGGILECEDKEKTARGKKRKNVRSTFVFNGRTICRSAFMLIYDVKNTYLQTLITHKMAHGPVPRTHGNSGRKPKHALSFEDIKCAIQYITNYTEEYGVPQPAAPRGRTHDPPIYLPCSTLKKDIHVRYQQNCENTECNVRPVKYKTFCKLWYSCLPHIRIASPRDDVCASCERLRKEIVDAVTEDDKLIATGKLRDHVMSAQKERDIYNDCIKRATATSGANPESRYNHYTFDFSQNVNIPHHARQMGPLYFTTPRKIHIFGVRIDSTPKQLNFLIDENECIGKDGSSCHGPNAVISMIDWVLQSYGAEETKAAFHADNCPGQNKNQFVLGYFMWRVLTGRHQEIEYLMQIPGHARCLVDAGFASLKQKFRKSDCDTIDQLTDVVNKSSITNEAVRFPTWNWRDWKAFLTAMFKPVRGIRQYQYFRFSANEPGVVTMRKSREEAEIKVDILKRGVAVLNNSPAVIQPAGLSLERQTYLRKFVRPYVRPAYQDVTCPELTGI